MNFLLKYHILLDKFEQKIPDYFKDIIIERDYHTFKIGKCLDITLHYFKVIHIYVNHLDKCEYSGTESLILLEKLARNFSEILYIELEDMSNIYIRDSKNNNIFFSL